MDERSANAMQKDLYDTAGFWKYMRRVGLEDRMVLETVIQRAEGHLVKLGEMLENAKLDEAIAARREA